MSHKIDTTGIQQAPQAVSVNDAGLGLTFSPYIITKVVSTATPGLGFNLNGGLPVIQPLENE
jgi:hypothetical protein